MSEEIRRKRECDACGVDLTYCDHPYTWHLKLEGVTAEFKGRSYVGYDPHPIPPGETHFCNGACLRDWLEKNPDQPQQRINF